MIKVNKDFHHIPEMLFIKAKKMIERSLRDGKLSFDVRRFLRHKQIKDRLLEIYHHKCAYCESAPDFGYELFMSHYRPISKYYWLSLEWSNLLPLCSRCHSYRRGKFPIEDESKRVNTPQEDRRQWIANSPSFFAEKPLLLHPEIDDPGKSLTFTVDGRIHGLDKRGQATIETFGLNRFELVSARQNIIKGFQLDFKSNLAKVSEKIKEDGIQDNDEVEEFLRQGFKTLFINFFNRAKPESSYSLLGRCMIDSFQSFFIDPLEPGLRPLLVTPFKWWEKFYSSSWREAVQLDDPAPLGKITVETLKIENIKCFKKTELPFNGNTTLLLGINGRGKSTILQLLALGLSKLQRPPTISDWLQVIKKGQVKAAFSIGLNTSKGKVDLNFSIDEDDNITCENAGEYDPVKENVLILAYGSRRSVNRGDIIPNKKYEGIASLFGDVEYLKNIRDSKDYENVKAGFDSIKNKINKILRLAEKSYTVGLDHLNSDGWYFKTPTDFSGSVPLEAMSDGFKSTFVFLFDLVVRAWERGADINNLGNIPGIVMIDEIDLHLHPSWQRTILPVLTEEFPKIQFIVATHSPYVVQSMRTNNIILLGAKKEKEEVTAEKLTLDGKPYGHEIEKIIEAVIGAEQEVPGISIRLMEMLKEFEKAVEDGNKQRVTHHYNEIKKIIPRDSDFTEYLKIMSAGLLVTNSK